MSRVLTAHDCVVLEDSERRFSDFYNRASFLFEHGLKDHPLFELDSLVQLSARRPPSEEFAYWSYGSVKVRDGWNTNLLQKRSLQETIEGISVNDSLVMLKRVELDPVFAPVLLPILSGLQSLVGPTMQRDVVIGRATILVASPRRITSYHIDSDINYLFQVSGDKKLSVFDHTNRRVLSEPELERYFSGDVNGAQFDDSKQPFAKTYDLRAGYGVHIPCTAPHWAQNLDRPSVALSINFDLRSMLRKGRVYRMNHKLRRVGVTPREPGRSDWRDQLKVASESMLSLASGFLRRT
jgi:hypothetical protein